MRPAVALDRREIGRRQRERPHLAPFGAEEERRAGGVARLVDEHVELERLPAVRVRQSRVAARVRVERRVERHVATVGEAAGLVRAVARAEAGHAVGDVVAEHRGQAFRIPLAGGDVRRGDIRVELERREQLVAAPPQRALPRRAREPLPQQTVHRVAHRPLATPLQRRGIVAVAQRRAAPLVELAALAVAPGAADQVGDRRLVVNGPGVVHRDRGVEQVPGVHGRAREVATDGVQQHLVPVARDRARRVVRRSFVPLLRGGGTWQARDRRGEQKGRQRGQESRGGDRGHERRDDGGHALRSACRPRRRGACERTGTGVCGRFHGGGRGGGDGSGRSPSPMPRNRGVAHAFCRSR